MGKVVLIMGRSGSGKTASLRNMDLKKVGIFNVAGKPLPFRTTKDITMANGAQYGVIYKSLIANKLKTYVIDDAGYLMAFEGLDRAKETGYNKFTEMAKHYYDLVQIAISKTSDDTVIFFINHTDTDEYGTRAKSYGKMLDSQLGSIEGLFTCVIQAVNDKGEYKFIVKGDGTSTVKTPMGMFDVPEIENDLQVVEDTIREYYDITQEVKKNAKTK